MVKEALKAGGLVANPGERVIEEITVKLGDAEVKVPMFLINGAQEGPILGITAGIHGCEFAGIAAALETGQKVDPAKLKGSIIIAAVSNYLAFRGRVPFVCPLDNKNVNRQFPGRADGTASEMLAHWLFQNVVTKSNYYIDLHGGDIVEALVPFTIFSPSGNETVDKVMLELCKVYGIHYVMEGPTGGSAYGAGSRAGIPSFIAESGQMGVWDPEMVAAHADGISRVMRHLGMVDGPPLEPIETEMLGSGSDLRSEHEGYFYTDVPIGAIVEKGQRLGAVRDLAGRELQVVEAAEDGIIVCLMTALSTRPGDILYEVGTFT